VCRQKEVATATYEALGALHTSRDASGSSLRYPLPCLVLQNEQILQNDDVIGKVSSFFKTKGVGYPNE
jgi:hypothetical protein